MGKFLVFNPLLALGVLKDLEASGSGSNSSGALLVALSSTSRVGPDGGMHLLVKVSEFLATESLLPATELLLEELSVLLLECLIIGLYVTTEDVRGVFLSVEDRLGLLNFLDLTTLAGHDLSFDNVEAGEALCAVRYIETTIGSTLHGTEDTVSSRSADKTDIEVSFERTLIIGGLVDNRVVLTVDLGISLVNVAETLLSEESASAKEASAVGSGVVGETGVETVSPELERVGRSHDLVTFESSVDDLGDDSAVGAAHAEPVLLGVILVLLLEDKALTGVVVSLSLSTPAESGLVPA